MTQPPKRTYEQLEVEIASLKEQVATLGWQPLTPKTEWEEGIELAILNKNCRRWVIFSPSSRKAMAPLHVPYTHYRRLNLPAKETSK